MQSVVSLCTKIFKSLDVLLIDLPQAKLLATAAKSLQPRMGGT